MSVDVNDNGNPIEEIEQEIVVDRRFTDYAGDCNEEVKQEEVVVDSQFSYYAGEHNEEVKKEEILVYGQFTDYIGEHDEEVKQEIVVDSQFRDYAGELDEEAFATKEGESVVIEAEEENEGIVDVSVVSKPEEAAVGKGEETPSSVGPPTIKELSESKSFSKDLESSLTKKDETVNLNNQKVSPKINLTSKIRDTKGVQTRDTTRVQKKPVSPVIRVQKKPVSPVTKSTQGSATRASKLVSPSTLTPLKPSMKKSVGLSSPRSKIALIGDNKKVSPRSLHMSISFEGPKSDPGHLTVTRKPLIMEKMGDKDIVKRAFRTFRNNFNQLRVSADMKSVGAKQIPTSWREVKAPATTPKKDSTGSTKQVFADKRTAKAAPSGFILKSDESSVKKKELPKKSDDQSSAKTSPQIKSNEEKEEDKKKLGQKLNLKTTPMSGSCRLQKFPKSPMDKVGSKTFRFSTVQDLQRPYESKIASCEAIPLSLCRKEKCQSAKGKLDHHPSVT